MSECHSVWKVEWKAELFVGPKVTWVLVADKLTLCFVCNATFAFILPSQYIHTYHVYFAKGVETVKATSPLTGFTGNWIETDILDSTWESQKREFCQIRKTYAGIFFLKIGISLNRVFAKFNFIQNTFAGMRGRRVSNDALAGSPAKRAEYNVSRKTVPEIPK